MDTTDRLIDFTRDLLSDVGQAMREIGDRPGRRASADFVIRPDDD